MASLLQEFENEAKALFDALDQEMRKLGALVWSDLKTVANASAGELAQLGAADLAALENMASQVVTSVEANPAFQRALGQWKFGAACAMLLQELGTGALTLIKDLGPATIETLIQAAFAAMTVG